MVHQAEAVSATPDVRAVPVAVASRGWIPIAIVSAAGVAAFLYPFAWPLLANVSSATSEPRTPDAPIVLAAVVALCLGSVLAQVSATGFRRGGPAKGVALLGTMVAVDAVLRLVPSLAGASAIFVLILVAGAVFGPSFGFLMGALTLLLSAVLTGGLGPWLPYQMLGAGWVGLTAGWVPSAASPTRRVGLLTLLGGAWGFGYGAILNLYAWPFAAPGLASEAGLYWHPGVPIDQTLARYGGYYLATSLSHDLFRAGANVLLLAALGPPLLRLLDRHRRRFA